MESVVKGVVIVGTKRMAFGTYGGKLSNTFLSDIQATSIKAALTSGGVKPELVDSVNVGNVLSNSDEGGIFTARHAALKSGIPIETPALGINKLCGSGFQAVATSCHDINTGLVEIPLAGGVDNMSAVPFSARNIRFGVRLGQNIVLEDSLWLSLTDTYSAQTLTCAKELKLDINELNVNGGAIAIGPPLAASGARITAHLVHELRRRKAKQGIGSACIGGGQGITVLIESL
ncbi:hypothetical protein HHI36_014110 [Cryptolaemus montrouzieri]|uniref:Thiolase N-terminal domain-containing protein n=1 Tax=Cryptolaemus montrouzieri TaxID=559131 RepID=A0ABD2N2K1_9CUCU